MRLRLQRRQRLVDLHGLTPFERAVMRFNDSEMRRTVEGLIRTLGEPVASVGASAGARDLVRITVAWDLTWYQWGVVLDEESQGVIELGRGKRVGELDAAARQWNASVVEGGRILLGAPRRRVRRR